MAPMIVRSTPFETCGPSPAPAVSLAPAPIRPVACGDITITILQIILSTILLCVPLRKLDQVTFPIRSELPLEP